MLETLRTLYRQPLKLLVIALALLPPLWALQFVAQYGVNLPYFDSLIHSLPLAIATRTGTLHPADIFTPYVGHITATSNLVTVILARLTDWNTWGELWLSLLLSFLAFAALLRLLNQAGNGAIWVGALPMGLLFFNLDQTISFLIGYAGLVWFGVILIFALMLVILLEWRGVWAVLVAALLGVIVTFTAASGFVAVWLCVPLVWLYQRGRWLAGLLLILAAAITALYIAAAGVQFGGESAVNNTVELDVLLSMFPFTLAFLGSLWTSSPDWALAVGGVGLMVLAVNSGYLLRYEQPRPAAWAWLVLSAFSLLNGALIALTRQDTYIGRFGAAFQTQYVTIVTLFWVALVALMAAATAHAYKNGGFRAPLVTVNTAALLIGCVVYMWGGFSTAYYADLRFINERCHWRYIYWQDVERSTQEDRCILIDQPHLINMLAWYNLNMFGAAQSQNILPETYNESESVVVVGEGGWETYHIRRWLLNGVSNIIPYYTDQPRTYPEYDVTLTDENRAATPDALADMLDGVDTFWVVGINQRTDALPPEFAADYIPVTTIYTTPERVDFSMTRYQRLVITEDTPILFGEGIRMVGYTSLSERLAACSTVTVRSFWEVTEPPLLDGYSATLTLDRVTGEGIWDFENVVRVDSALTSVPTNAWETGALYVDDRTLQIPCDLRAGEYALQLGVYNYRDGVRLPPTVDGEPPAAGQDIARIETITVD